ncbi:hypothetical protein Nepgr_008486 [Nepenthes gracilis]|uniref:Programmed cell death protein 2 C-terminal domain-containing protein n=1 Tax=Nepenthes gracilis TaxID=150966 RepID=A0AAD3XJH4_NEPGR|nr:hypothetical protein Nepgr_008486 [Nepenthes gracilis]
MVVKIIPSQWLATEQFPLYGLLLNPKLPITSCFLLGGQPDSNLSDSTVKGRSAMREVILGLPGPWVDDILEASDHYTPKIGGFPDWPFPKAFLRSHMLQCSACRGDLCLIAQVYAPISSATLRIEERVIYVFGCASSNCRSWHAIRVQKSETGDKTKIASQQVALSSVSSSVSTSKWWDDLYSFGSGGDDNFEDNENSDMEELGKALSKAANLASDSMKQNVKKHSETNEEQLFLSSAVREVDNRSLVLPCFYLYTEEESSKDVMSACSSYSLLSIKERRGNDDDHLQEVWEEEGYEYDRALNADRTYLKFKKRMDSYPEQCFRYSYGGKPLMATGELADPGTCSICGGSRHYEMQLMPPPLYFLQEAAIGGQKDLLDSWNWMTLIVYTCQKSCFEKTDGDIEGWMMAEEAVVAHANISSGNFAGVAVSLQLVASEYKIESRLQLCLEGSTLGEIDGL